MSSKTKIVVLHMKEIIYTVIFAVLAIILILLLIFMFRLEHRSASKDNRIYNSGNLHLRYHSEQYCAGS